MAEQSEGPAVSLLIVPPAVEAGISIWLRRCGVPFLRGKERDDMTIRRATDPTGAGRPRHGSNGAQWPHVGECTFAGLAVLDMVEQRDGSRVSAKGDAR